MKTAGYQVGLTDGELLVQKRQQKSGGQYEVHSSARQDGFLYIKTMLLNHFLFSFPYQSYI